MTKLTAMQRFDNKYRINVANGCHEWFGATTQQNRPMFAAASHRCVPAARFIWEHTHGPIPAGHEIINVCGVSICVNVAHLAIVTVAEHRSARTPVRGVKTVKVDRGRKMIRWLQATFPHVADELDGIAEKIGKSPVTTSVWERICVAREAAAP